LGRAWLEHWRQARTGKVVRRRVAVAVVIVIEAEKPGDGLGLDGAVYIGTDMPCTFRALD
jgi:hypothetical protein